MPTKAKKTVKSQKKAKKTVKRVETIPQEEKKKVIRRTYLFAVGRRKCSVARVRLYKKGEKEFIVNDKEYKKYFPTLEFQINVYKPLAVLGIKDYGKISIRVKGGGKRGQADAVKLGLARVLELLDSKNRKVLNAEGLLRRDPRVKERKKFGLKGARRAPQCQKR